MATMPKEVHYFLFSREETINALFGYYWLMTPPPRADRGVSATLNRGEHGITAVLKIDSIATGKGEFVKFDSDQVLSALVLYCQERRIPLSARANKLLEQFGDQIALLTTLNLGSARPEASGDKVRYTDEALEASRRNVG
jgi:hypothetical protein